MGFSRAFLWSMQCVFSNSEWRAILRHGEEEEKEGSPERCVFTRVDIWSLHVICCTNCMLCS